MGITSIEAREALLAVGSEAADRDRFTAEIVDGGWLFSWAAPGDVPVGTSAWVVADNGVVRALDPSDSPSSVLAELLIDPGSGLASGVTVVSPGPPMDPETACVRVSEIRDFFDALHEKPRWERTGEFYAAVFDDLDLAVRDLLHIIDKGLGTSAW